MRFARNARVFRGQIDFAPLASVFFLLVIFILLNSGLVFTPGVRLELPIAASEPLPGIEGPTVVVAIDAGGQLYFHHQITALEPLRSQLSALAKTQSPLTLVVQADQSVRYDTIVRLSLVAREAGIRQVLLATRPHPAPESSSSSP
jgi:biopolymer transport protein ExbD